MVSTNKYIYNGQLNASAAESEPHTVNHLTKRLIWNVTSGFINVEPVIETYSKLLRWIT